MCDATTKSGTKCKRPAKYMVHIVTHAQPLGKDGIWGMETSPSGRSNTTCATHVAVTADRLNALPITVYSATATVRKFA